MVDKAFSAVGRRKEERGGGDGDDEAEVTAITLCPN
jgi:hypothetical protein